MKSEPVNVLDEEYGSNAPPYPEDAVFFVLVRGQHSHRIKTQKVAPDWATVKARSGGRGWEAVYHAGDGIPKLHFPESARRANGYKRVVPVDDDGFPVVVADQGLSAEERAVNQFRVRVERRSGAVYLDVGEMFVEEPQRLSPTHAVARK